MQISSALGHAPISVSLSRFLLACTFDQYLRKKCICLSHIRCIHSLCALFNCWPLQLLATFASAPCCNSDELQTMAAGSIASLWPWMADLNALFKQCSVLRTISYNMLFIYYWRKLQLFLFKIKRFFFRDSLELRSQIESIETLKT